MEITEEEQVAFDVASSCWICGGETVDGDVDRRKVRDHCHLSGKYRGAAHNKCNLPLKEDKTIPVAFHNGHGYDFHLFVRSLGRVDGHIRTIAKNSEQYISVDKSVHVGEKTVVDDGGNSETTKNTWKIRFIDSYGFLQASLENLVKNFPKEKFKMLGEVFEGEKFDLVLRKGVFLYEWFDDIRNLDETEFPLKEAFYSSLTGEGVSVEEYEHGQNVKEKLDLKTMRDYLDFYCRVDVLQLADIMEYQRDRLMCTHGLDILHSFTLPGFSWRAALKFTGQELELISDRGMYDFIQKAKRGGISTNLDDHSPVREGKQPLHRADQGKDAKRDHGGTPNEKRKKVP